MKEIKIFEKTFRFS